jgi:hypothetical protein
MTAGEMAAVCKEVKMNSKAFNIVRVEAVS